MARCVGCGYGTLAAFNVAGVISLIRINSVDFEVTAPAGYEFRTFRVRLVYDERSEQSEQRYVVVAHYDAIAQLIEQPSLCEECHCFLTPSGAGHSSWCVRDCTKERLG